MGNSMASKQKDKTKLIQRFQNGEIDLPEAMVRIKALRKGWGESKIQKRIAWRRRASKAWSFRDKIPFRPLGGLIAGAGDQIAAGVKQLQDIRIS